MATVLRIVQCQRCYAHQLSLAAATAERNSDYDIAVVDYIWRFGGGHKASQDGRVPLSDRLVLICNIKTKAVVHNSEHRTKLVPSLPLIVVWTTP